MPDENQSYESVVSESVSCLIDEMREEFESGTTGEALQDCLSERMHEHCDGHAWVIYTHYAKKIVCESKNSGAYMDEFGDDGGMTDGGEIAWSRLAFMALHQDILDAMFRLDFDPNNPSKFFESEAQDAAEKKERA